MSVASRPPAGTVRRKRLHGLSMSGAFASTTALPSFRTMEGHALRAFAIAVPRLRTRIGPASSMSCPGGLQLEQR